MKSWVRPLLASLLGVSWSFAPMAACGSRTGLPLPERAVDASQRLDAFVGAEPQANGEASREAGPDADARVEAEAEAPGEPDVFFPIDVTPPVDSKVPVDSSIACPDGGLPTAYLFDMNSNLYVFDPATLAVTLLGNPHCAVQGGPWTLSVSREKTAYLVYFPSVSGETWQIWQVDLTTLACSETAFQAGQLGIWTDFSIAVSRNSGAEKLFVYGIPTAQDTLPSSGSPILAGSDLTHFALSEIAPVTPAPPFADYPVDMQGDPQGHLYGLTAGGLLFQIDSTNGHVLGQAQTPFAVPHVDGGGEENWAVMSYNGQVYLFSGQGNLTKVGLYSAFTGQTQTLGTIDVGVVGASAVPCLSVE